MTIDPNPPEPVFQPLDPRVVRLWRIGQVIRSAVWLAIFLAASLALKAAALCSWTAVAGLMLALALVRLWLFFWYPPRAHAAWGYRLDGQVIEIRHGIWWHTLELLPLSRLQHVDLQSGPIERSLGLATLTLHTAGTHLATLAIPGLDAAEAARLRDQLVAVGGDDGV